MRIQQLVIWNIISILTNIAGSRMEWCQRMILSKLECWTRKSLRFLSLFLLVIFLCAIFDRGLQPPDLLESLHNKTGSCLTECLGWSWSSWWIITVNSLTRKSGERWTNWGPDWQPVQSEKSEARISPEGRVLLLLGKDGDRILEWNCRQSRFVGF